jgi:hypothetical protein
MSKSKRRDTSFVEIRKLVGRWAKWIEKQGNCIQAQYKGDPKVCLRRICAYVYMYFGFFIVNSNKNGSDLNMFLLILLQRVQGHSRG